MTDQTVLLATLNAGEVSPLALARVDQSRLRAAAQIQQNLLPHPLGYAVMRPGTTSIAEVPADAVGWLGEFVYDSVTALLVATAAGLQILAGDAWVSRVAVATAIGDGTFAALTDWTDSSQSGASCSLVSGGVKFVGTGTNYAQLDQQITVAGGDVGKEHAVRLVVSWGWVRLQIGTAQGDNSIQDITVRPGNYSIAFTPAGNFWVRVGGVDSFGDVLQSIAIEAAGAVSLPVPWAQADLAKILYDQSGNEVLLACAGYQQQTVTRFATSYSDTGTRSWGIGGYLADDGPFLPANTGPIAMTPAATTGSTTLTASQPFFKQGHVGALFQLTQQGQTATGTLAGASQETGNIRVTGLSNTAAIGYVASQRAFGIVIQGTFVATITLQASYGAPGNWVDIKSWTAPTSESYDDGLDNQIVYYQLAIKTGAYTSGSATCQLFYTNSVQTGVCRVYGYSSSTVAFVSVLQEFGQAGAATSVWSEGEWSGWRGWPAALQFYEGRLAQGQSINLDASVSDAFDSYDPATTGDAGPIDRTVAGAIRWLMSLQRLIAGTALCEISIRASALDEPLTPTAFVARTCSTRGSYPIRPLKFDQSGVFIGRDGVRVFELQWTAASAFTDYASRELSEKHQEVLSPGVVDLAVQRYPNTRFWFVKSDGTAAVLTQDDTEEVLAWTPVATASGDAFERVAALPGQSEDAVYFIARRQVNGVTRRYVEKLAMLSEVTGGTLNKVADAMTVYSGGATSTVSCPQLAGRQVTVWADGAARNDQSDLLTVPVGGTLTLGASYSSIVVGLPYNAQYQSAKLAFGGEKGSPVEQQKRVARVGLVMANVCPNGVSVGRDFSHLYSLGATYKGQALTAGQVLASWDAVPSSFSGGWDSDARVCLQIAAPYPATIMALALYMKTNEPDDTPAQPESAPQASPLPFLPGRR